MKAKLKQFFSDYVLWGSSLLGLIILFVQLYLMLNYEFTLKYYFRIAFALVYPVSLFFFGRKAIFPMFFIFSLMIETQCFYDNWTAFFIVAIGCSVFNSIKFKLFSLGTYLLVVFFTAQAHSRDPVFICFHLITCILIYFGVEVFFHRYRLNKIEPLKLTEDEENIIKQLAEGKLQKEIDLFNKNTITKKISQALERNKCSTKAELILRYQAFSRSQY